MEKEKEEMKKVWVLGHKNPDTDSICAAIAYAALKNATEKDTVFVAKRAGQINEETRYVLEHFDVKEPELAEDAGAQIKDIAYRRTEGVSSHISIKRAWEMMKKPGRRIASNHQRGQYPGGTDRNRRYSEILYGCAGQPDSCHSQDTV